MSRINQNLAMLATLKSICCPHSEGKDQNGLFGIVD